MFRIWAAGVAATLLLVASPASALHMVAEAEGTFYNDTVTLPFELTLTYDLGAAEQQFDNTAQQDVYVSGSDYGLPTLMSMTLTIDGTVYNLTGDRHGIALQHNMSVQQSLLGSAAQVIIGAGYPSHDVPDMLPEDYLPRNVLFPPAGNLCVGILNCYGSVALSDRTGQLAPTSYTVTVHRGPGIPEPATWALMIAGFGLAGGALRQRRRVAA